MIEDAHKSLTSQTGAPSQYATPPQTPPTHCSSSVTNRNFLSEADVFVATVLLFSNLFLHKNSEYYVTLDKDKCQACCAFIILCYALFQIAKREGKTMNEKFSSYRDSLWTRLSYVSFKGKCELFFRLLIANIKNCIRGRAFRKGYNSLIIGSYGPIQIYSSNPYSHRTELKKFCDWHGGVGHAAADRIIADCKGYLIRLQEIRHSIR